MKKYRFISEDDNLFHVEHPDGSRFAIAKNAIGPGVHKAIKALDPVKMADGGEVEDSEDTDREPASKMSHMDQPSTDDAFAKAMAKIKGAGTSQELADASSQVDAAYQEEPAAPLPDGNLLPGLSTQQAGPSQPYSPPAGSKDAAPSYIDQFVQHAGDYAPGHMPTPAINATLPAAFKPPVQSAPVAPQAFPPVSAIQKPQAPQAAQPGLYGNIPDDPFAGPMAQMQKGIDTQTAASQGQSSDIQKAFQDQQAQQADIIARSVPILAQNEAEHKQLFDAVINGKVDPHRFWHNLSTGQQIGAAIAVALGGVGQGMMHTNSNAALDVINKAISRDMQAQEFDISKKDSLLNENLRRYGTIQAARQATLGQLYTTTAAQVAAAQAKASGIQATGQNQILSGQLGMQAQQMRMQLAMNLANAVEHGIGRQRGWNPGGARTLCVDVGPKIQPEPCRGEQ